MVKLGKIIDWTKIKKSLRGIHKNELSPWNGGQKAYDSLKMLKTILLKEWHSLSDPEMEEALRVRVDFMVFTGFEIGEELPDETTICRFRNALIKQGLDKKIFEEVNKELVRLGLKVEKSKGAVIDATIIESAARPRKVIEIVNDREEAVVVESAGVQVEESVDKDAKWLKKGKRSYFGYKGFVVTDVENGYIENLKAEPANVSEIGQLGEMLSGVKARRVYADKGYASRENREILKEQGYKDGIMYKGARGRELTEREKRINKMVSKKRYIVEQCFGTMKRVLNFSRSSSMGKEKVEGQLRLKAICFNLLKAMNQSSNMELCNI